MKTIFFSLILAVLLISFRLNAQETSVFLDKENKIDVIGKESAKKLDLFPEYKDIEEIRLYMTPPPDSTYFLEIIYHSDGNRQKTRIKMTQTEVDNLRTKITNSIYNKDVTLYRNVEGKSYLLWSTAYLSLGLWGWSLPYLAGMDGTPAVGGYFLFSGLGFLLPFITTSNRDITTGMANFAVSGGQLGAAHGALLALTIGGNDASGKGVVGGMLLGSIAEYVVNLNIADKNKFSGGKASIIAGYGWYGGFFGIYTAGLLNMFDNHSPSLPSATILAASGLGYYIGNSISNSQNYTEGDASIVFTSGFLGTALPVSVLILSKETNDKAYYALMAVGGLAGLWIGDRMVTGYDFTTSHGTYSVLATLGGGLIGTGLGLLISSDDKSNARAFPLLATIGAGCGFVLSYEAFKNEAIANKSMGRLNLEFNPASFALGKLINKGTEPVNIPFMSVRYGF